MKVQIDDQGNRLYVSDETPVIIPSTKQPDEKQKLLKVLFFSDRSTCLEWKKQRLETSENENQHLGGGGGYRTPAVSPTLVVKPDAEFVVNSLEFGSVKGPDIIHTTCLIDMVVQDTKIYTIAAKSGSANPLYIRFLGGDTEILGMMEVYSKLRDSFSIAAETSGLFRVKIAFRVKTYWSD